MSLKRAFIFGLVGLAASSPILQKRAISCLTVGTLATAQWVNSAGETCTYTGLVGSNYGPNPSGSGEYVDQITL